MKQFLIALAMLLTLSATAPVAAQKHRHHPSVTAPVVGQKNQVKDSADNAQKGSDEVVAYSDTTSIDTATTTTVVLESEDDYDGDDDFGFLNDIFGGALSGTVAVVAIIMAFLFLIAPFIALVLIVWLLVRNRNRKYKLAEKAVESGQQIPQELLRTEQQSGDYLWRRGIRNAAVGLGLVAFFYCLGADPLAGIGWLVMFYGVGQAIIGYRDRKKNDDDHFEVEK